MKQAVNPELEKTLQRQADDSRLISALMESLWRGGGWIVPYVTGEKRLRIRMQGRECLPVFTAEAHAAAFQQMISGRGGPALLLWQEPVEQTLYPLPGCSLILNAGQENSVLLEESALESVTRLTARLTGGRTPAEDLPLMQLHMETVGNGERAVRSELCACFHCGAKFAPVRIPKFTVEADGRRTAICPECGVDAVLTGMDRLPLTDELIAAMKNRFFSGTDSEEDGVMRLIYMQCVRARLDAQTR